MLTDWHVVPDTKDTYLCISCCFDVNDASNMKLEIQEGANDEEGNIYDTDAFLDIKCDKDSITQAVNAIISGNVPLHNKGHTVTNDTCPFAFFYED